MEKKLGLIVNPIAGMGGAVGLKGSDGPEILKQARTLGAIPQAPRRTHEFLEALRPIQSKLRILTLPGIMGGDEAIESGYQVDFIADPAVPKNTMLFQTTSIDTISAAKALKNSRVDLLVFVGGDGTARNIFEGVGLVVPCLGIPGGVKIHSSVFATTPIAAAHLVMQYLWDEVPLREAEVLDIDEEEFRHNRVVSKLYVYLNTPYSLMYSQPSKMGTPQTQDEAENQRALAQWIVEEMDKLGDDWYYLIGPGTTPRAIAMVLNQEKTLLGVDLFYQKKCIAKDLNENTILSQIDGKKAKLIVTPIGAQGFLFGRGNLQLSARVLQKIGYENVMIIATKYKMSTISSQNLSIDSRDPEFDKKFAGYYRVLVDYAEFRIIYVVA